MYVKELNIADNFGSTGPAKKFKHPSNPKISSAISITGLTGAYTDTSSNPVPPVKSLNVFTGSSTFAVLTKWISTPRSLAYSSVNNSLASF